MPRYLSLLHSSEHARGRMRVRADKSGRARTCTKKIGLAKKNNEDCPRDYCIYALPWHLSLSIRLFSRCCEPSSERNVYSRVVERDASCSSVSNECGQETKEVGRQILMLGKERKLTAYRTFGGVKSLVQGQGQGQGMRCWQIEGARLLVRSLTVELPA